MSRLLSENGFDENLILPKDKFRLCIDEKEVRLNDEKMQVIVKKAEALLDEPIRILPVSHYWKYVVNGDRKETSDGYFDRRDMALNLAYAESYEKKGRFIEKLVDVVWAIMEETTWVIPAHYKSNTITAGDTLLPSVYMDGKDHGIGLFAASTAAVLAMVYKLCGDQLDEYSPVICERIVYSIKERISTPYVKYNYWWDGESGGRVLNWCPWITSNILLAVGLTEEDDGIRRSVVAKAIRSCDAYSQNGALADGGCDEGPGYWGAAGASYFDCLELLYDLSGGKINVYSIPAVKNMLEFIAKVNVNGRRFLNFADCAPESSHDGAMIRRMGEKCGSKVLESFGDLMSKYNKPNVNHGHAYRGFRGLITPHSAASENLGMKRVWLPTMKIMVSRECERTDKGMMLAMTGGANGTAHSHNDIGNVTVYYNGAPVLIDAGAGTYTKKTFSSERYTLWNMQSCYHNVADINGRGQKNGWEYKSSDEAYDEATGGVSMQLAGAYEPDVGVSSYLRRAVLDGAVAKIRDSFKLAAEGEIDIHFITHKKPELLEGRKITLPEGRVMTYQEGLAASVEEFETGDDALTERWGSPVLYRIHLKARITEAEFEITVE